MLTYSQENTKRCMSTMTSASQPLAHFTINVFLKAIHDCEYFNFTGSLWNQDLQATSHRQMRVYKAQCYFYFWCCHE